MSLLDKASLIVTPNGYSEDTLYSVVPSSGAGDLSFTRTTDAWRTNSQGLIQRTPWNLLRFSEQFENVFWSKNTSTVISNNAIAPNGTLTADKIFPNSTGSVRGLFTVNNPVNTYNFSVFAKAEGKNFLYFYVIGSTSNTGVWFNLSNGTVGTVGASWTNAAITNVGNGWYRCSANVSLINVSNNLYYFISDANNDINVTANGSDGILLWGAQLTESTSTLEYFPTTDRLDVPRIDYSLGGCPNILLEPQRTNLALQSSSFDSATWAKLGATLPIVTANTAISPSGIMDADSLKFANIASAAIVYQSLSHTSGQQITVSVYAKRNAATDQVFRLFGDMGSSISSIFTATSEWQRFTYTFTASATGSRSMGIYNVSNFASDIQIWGYQFEVGAYPTSYIPTTTASVTRNADSFTRNNVFTNGLITAAGGTWFVEIRNNRVLTRDTSANGIFLLDSSLSSFGFRIKTYVNARLAISKVIASGETSLFTTTTDTVKLVIKWNGTTADVFQNGVKVVSATAFTPTNMESLGAATLDVPKYINEMALFPTPLTDVECIALTT